MIDIFLPEFTKVPDTNWRMFIHVLTHAPAVDRRIHTPMVLAYRLKKFVIVKSRIGVIQTEKQIAWYHICRPVKLSDAIDAKDIEADEPWYDLNWRFGHFNRLPDRAAKEWKCWKCYARLTNPEIMMVKAAILEMRT
jgi:hypothetical protein